MKQWASSPRCRGTASSLSAVKIGPALAAGQHYRGESGGERSYAAAAADLDCPMRIPGGRLQRDHWLCRDDADAVNNHPDVDHIAFTGGPETARHIVRNSAENLSKTTLELGGKSPLSSLRMRIWTAPPMPRVGDICRLRAKLRRRFACWWLKASKSNCWRKWSSGLNELSSAADDAATQFGLYERQKRLIEQVVSRSLGRAPGW